MIEFLKMGGHGVYIWPCYVLSFILLLGMGCKRYKKVKSLRQSNALEATPPAKNEA